ncbi:MAG: NAD(P)H-dependent glycerol-3-phosphate dehydrogenase, partial [Rhodothermales bacterium]
ARNPDFAHILERERRNRRYLPGTTFPNSIRVTSSLPDAVRDASVWVFATPTQAMRSVAEQVAACSAKASVAVSVAKGIENRTLRTTTQILSEVLTDLPREAVGVLYGPSHAEEVAVGVPTAVVASAKEEDVARIIQRVFFSQTLRVYVNLDLIGVEIAGSVKNVMAIAAGISDGVGYGDNTKAAIVTRGIAEITRLGMAIGAQESTFAGLAGIGDLVVTCMSKHSRNRFLGEEIGRGRNLSDIESHMNMVAEGVRTTESVMALAMKYGVEMPITEAVHKILFEGKQPEEAVYDLMTRSAKHEAFHQPDRS